MQDIASILSQAGFKLVTFLSLSCLLVFDDVRKLLFVMP